MSERELEISQHQTVKVHGRRAELPRVESTTRRLAEIQYVETERILFLPVHRLRKRSDSILFRRLLKLLT